MDLKKFGILCKTIGKYKFLQILNFVNVLFLSENRTFDWEILFR